MYINHQPTRYPLTCIYARNPNCLYQPIKGQYLSPWQLISKLSIELSGRVLSGTCGCVPVFLHGRVQQLCLITLPGMRQANFETPPCSPCVQLLVSLLGRNAKLYLFIFFSTLYTRRDVRSDSRHLLPKDASESIFICLNGRLASHLAKPRQATPCRRGRDQAEHVGGND